MQPTVSFAMLQPDYIFEASWEVCNRVGGIYAVLSTRARVMQAEYPDHVIFLGPDLKEQSDRFFVEDASLTKQVGLPRRCVNGPAFRIGRWQVPGQPIAILLDYSHLWEQKNTIYGWAWEHFGVQSHAAMGDYDDSSLFGYAVGQMVEKMVAKIKSSAVFHANEWQTAFAIFYLRDHCPQVGTLFTTHATGIGRSIAGNGKPLYDYFAGYHGDQMAQELGMVSKHSAEKQAAHACDVFTTVSDLTARECDQLLERKVDIVTPNAFELDFVPKGNALTQARRKARKALISTAEQMLQQPVGQEAVLVGIAGRYEWKNKGIDLYLDAMQALAEREKDAQVVAFVMIPYLERASYTMGNVSVVFLPYYLPVEQESLPISGMAYYDLLPGLDMTVFPSYYEPWGYTPMESVAFRVPTITTDLAGFGLWYSDHPCAVGTGLAPVTVLHRTDSNYHEVVDGVVSILLRFIAGTATQKAATRKAAASLIEQATWAQFFDAYRKAYVLALTASQSRVATIASSGRLKK